MEIMAKDFWRHVGKSIMIPHPNNPTIMPVKVKIAGIENKKIILVNEETGDKMIENFSKDKTKYKVLD